MALETIADAARLAAVRELGLLDTPPEAEFDRFILLVCNLLDVPVSLIDRDRQFFKTRCFLDGVETELLRLSGYHWGQGFLFAEPLPADQIQLPERREAAPTARPRLAVAD